MRPAEIKSYVPSFEVGKPLENFAVVEVLRSENEKFSKGQKLYGYSKFQTYSVRAWLGRGGQGSLLLSADLFTPRRSFPRRRPTTSASSRTRSSSRGPPGSARPACPDRLPGTDSSSSASPRRARPSLSREPWDPSARSRSRSRTPPDARSSPRPARRRRSSTCVTSSRSSASSTTRCVAFAAAVRREGAQFRRRAQIFVHALTCSFATTPVPLSPPLADGQRQRGPRQLEQGARTLHRLR
jgi:hypothetical protein